MLYASDGPNREENLREKIVGTVVGILVPDRGSQCPRSAEPEAGPAADPTEPAQAAEDGTPLTVEGAASLDRPTYDFSDVPLRSPQEWAETFCNQALGMHFADKTLRMSKPELVAFIREAAGGGEGVDETLYKAIDDARENLQGWAKLLDVARARFLVAGATYQLEQDAKKVGA
ncbi:hypothetical protein [Methylobacterium mesophilicum]|uniref:hypothetical protein n=1 Tax=Methylobacterium mesophilicum TaxID=39956 RepID=UPI0002C60FF9|nr:hypothetical protein [Methylobacterium mesophilicum]